MKANEKAVLISGGTGLIGSALTQKLRENGHPVYILTRSPKSSDDTGLRYVKWDPELGEIDTSSLPEVPYVINLAGAPIVGSRWTESYKRLIIDSRVKSALTLKKYFASRDQAPEFFLGASAIGIYGNSGDTLVDESMTGNQNRFIVQSVEAWESAHRQIQDLDIRTVILRIGLVLSNDGGMMEKMRMSGRFGVFGYFGDGQQWQSWIHIEDLVGSIIHLMGNEQNRGIYNGVAPHPVTAKAFAKSMRKASGWGIVSSVPTIGLKIGLGEAHKILLDSCRATADKLESSGYQFKYKEIDQAMANLMGA